MTNLKQQYSHFIDEIKMLEEYENKDFFKKIFSSYKPNEQEIIKTLNDFVLNTLLKEITNFQDVESFKSSFNWYNLIKDFLYPESIFKILSAYQELPFIDKKTYNQLENYKAMQMQIRVGKSFDSLLNKFM
ncbi:hypothetical protein [Flavivirga rizhaonensis]|uniref:Uncharacterized protein n=1 Tax=Flavivirga rizhaonensis TaxID=2559571 RepID=A0A4S1DYV5_9FLAO|nr:hypothetical protein [Flavivirga rizhaonensis]TGV02758.1 hypothetical protein EM932_10025 [Flavivirga rizhaonensis]